MHHRDSDDIVRGYSDGIARGGRGRGEFFGGAEGRRRFRAFLCGAVLLIGGAMGVVDGQQDEGGAGGAAANGAAAGGARVAIVPIHGEINRAQVVLLRRAIERAKEEGAEYLIVEIDTFGGRVDSALQITTLLGSLDTIETIAFVPITSEGTGVSWSAGALISMACDQIFMSPGTSIGAATPVQPQGDGSVAASDEKTLSAVRTQMAALAEKNGYPQGVALAMVDRDVELFEVYQNGELIGVRTPGEYRALRAAAGVSDSDGAGGDGESASSDDGAGDDAQSVGDDGDAGDGENGDAGASDSDTAEASDTTEAGDTEATADDTAEAGDRSAAGGGFTIGMTVSEVGKLLTLTAGQMERYKVSSGSPASYGELYALLGITDADPATPDSPPQEIRIQNTALDNFVAFLTSGAVISLLIVAGLIGLFIEITSPGFGLPGALGLLAFAIVFGANFLLGRVGSLELLLLLCGVILIVLELFLIPGFGVAGISGILLVGLSLVLAQQDFTIPRFAWQWRALGASILYVGAALVGGLVFFLALTPVASRGYLFRRLALLDTQKPEAGYTVQTDDQRQALLNKKGVTISTLRPTGRAKFNGEIFVVESDGEFIEANVRVVIKKVDSNRILVRAV